MYRKLLYICGSFIHVNTMQTKSNSYKLGYNVVRFILMATLIASLVKLGGYIAIPWLFLLLPLGVLMFCAAVAVFIVILIGDKLKDL